MGLALIKTSETDLWTTSVPSATGGQLIGVVLEFTIVTTTPMRVYFRTFCTPTSNKGSSSDPVADSDGKHVRGWWDKSRITLPLTFAEDVPLDLNPNAYRFRQNILIDKLGPEHATPSGFGAHPNAGVSGDGHEFDRANLGCYGVNLEYSGVL